VSAQAQPDRSLERRVRIGAMWAAGSVMLMRFANIATMAVVARLVAPHDLGVFALAVTAHLMIMTFAEFGVSSALARADLDPERIAPTITTIALGTSLMLSSAMALLAAPLAEVVGSADAAGPLRVLSISVALMGISAVPAAQLQRELRQDRVFRAVSIGFVAGTAVLLVLAAKGNGALAFAWGRVVEQLVSAAVMLLSVNRRYLPGFDRAEFGPLMRFGVPLAAANLLSQLLLNVDYVIVGHSLTVADVGVYMLAFNVSAWPAAVLGSMLNSVVVPGFSRVRHDPERLRGALARAARIVALIACPIGALTSALALPLIVTLYGAKWQDAASVLVVLTLHGILFVFGLLFANLIIVTGRTGILLGVQVLVLVCLVPAMIVGVHALGLVGVGVAHIVVICLITMPIYVVAVRRSTGFGFGQLVKAVWPVARAAIGATLAARGGAMLVEPAFVKLVVGGMAGAAVYGLLTAPLLADLLPEGSAPSRAFARFTARWGRFGRPALEHASRNA
jgi:lipopolysaccharide exporter